MRSRLITLSMQIPNIRPITVDLADAGCAKTAAMKIMIGPIAVHSGAIFTENCPEANIVPST